MINKKLNYLKKSKTKDRKISSIKTLDAIVALEYISRGSDINVPSSRISIYVKNATKRI